MTSPDEKPVPTLNIANILTMLRIVMVPLFAWFYVLDVVGGQPQYEGWRWAAVAMFALAMYTDKLDGDIARSRGLITDFGKIADPIADKLLTGAALVLFSICGELSWWATGIILVREWGITAMRFVVIRYSVMPASRGGKVKTVTQALAILLYLLPVTHMFDWLGIIAAIVMWAAVALTLVTGLDYIVQAVRLRKQGRRE
ncbi:CDP-diacylglycerol--glycerol-3-phosphate 3-phosphatidyltransferase [Zhihengliuella salsuginis]|uniref:CDP-diacylglycerol--glycerol-3-phosphate 3-phosphatidyltransferase n=1 Tax=Zhihengliuella salsuginis TaxID=578222 RepID=A0ABQ3GHQ4_9MICC|nr:CDP-diacylglycerol--glycerol-3-phosphate 3-phosphatidyltransferase [Zhihengliuella salsuginis]GHD07331.1 CDP-diacylglycerol--glycerol-3-phosphate 3-phosphatidyltransferase [Zhihengliuella salsuginis]